MSSPLGGAPPSPPPLPAGPVDVEFMKGEIFRPLAAGVALNLFLSAAHPETGRFILLSGFLLQYTLTFAALAVLHSELTDDVEPCSQIIGYCGSISCPGGVAYPQAQVYLTVQALLLNASLLYAVRRYSARRAASYDRSPAWFKLLTGRWGTLCFGGSDTVYISMLGTCRVCCLLYSPTHPPPRLASRESTRLDASASPAAPAGRSAGWPAS